MSKKLEVPRTTIYWLLEGLAKRGVVAVEKKKKRSTLYRPTKPETLIRMVRREREELHDEMQRKEQAANRLAETLAPYFARKPFSVPKLQVFEGQDSVRNMLFDYLTEFQASLANNDYTWWEYQDPGFAAEYTDWLRATWKRKMPKEKYCVATNPATVEEKLKQLAPHRVMRFIPEHIRFVSTIWVVGDYICLIVTAKRPHYAFLLKDELLSTNLRAVFRMNWEAMERAGSGNRE